MITVYYMISEKLYTEVAMEEITVRVDTNI